MSLENFKTDNENKYHPNDKLDKKKLYTEGLCPSCGEEGEKVEGEAYTSTYRCKNCEVLTFSHPETSNNATVS